MNTNQEVLSVLKSRLTNFRTQFEKNNKTVSTDYMRFFHLYADENYKLTCKINFLSDFFPEDGTELDETKIREYLQSGVDLFISTLLEGPIQCTSTNTMLNLAHSLKLEAMQDLLKLYKYMLSKYEK